ncbi:putative BRCT domain-containing protein [Dioscorea sansibarensis]
MRPAVFEGASVFLSRSLVPPEAFDAVHDALRLNGARVFLCCDPSRNAPSEFHVISSLDHEKFEYLRSKGCKLLGPQCVLSCAKERKTLPNQGYTCCLAMEGVKVLASGFEKDEKVKIELLVTAMGGELHTKPSLDIDFVVVNNVLATKYKWALNVLKKPIVNVIWVYQCWTEHRIVPQEPFKVPPFSGLTVCVTKIPADERKEMEKFIVENGGHYSADLTKNHILDILHAPGGDKYMVAKRWGHIHIVTRRWVHQSIARKACLDEGFYPVVEALVSSSNVKTSQKELGNQLQTSEPIPPTEFGDLETTLSQNMSATFSDATKTNSEHTDAPVIRKKVEEKIDRSVAEDSETEDNDLYLSNCRILLLGLDEKQLSKSVTMIRRGGGSRHMLLSEKLTHIIIGNPSEMEKKEVRRLAAWGVINVVKATWLEECDLAKGELPVSLRHLVRDMLPPKASTCSTWETAADFCSSKKGKSFSETFHMPMNKVSEDRTFEVGSLAEKEKVRENSENRLSRSGHAELATSSEQSNRIYSMKSARNDNLKRLFHSGTVGSSKKSSNMFQGQSFCFSSSFPEDRRPEIIEWVREGGGQIIDHCQMMNANFIIETHGSFQGSPVASQSIVVSPHWIRFCLEDGRIQDVGNHVLFSPLYCRVPFPGFEQLRFCVSQYEEKDRLLLRNLCHTLGAKFTEKLTKKVTHLLCKFTSGPKYEAACKWGIHSVTADWITECIKQDAMVSLEPFWPKAATAQDREAGLCTVSQYPTQAAHMVIENVSSRLTSDSQVPIECQNANAGVADQRHSMAFAKRPRLSENNSMNVAADKIRTTEDVKEESNAVPDVADAIEDLLAQSNKIHDMKSPQGSGCDRSTFSPQHPIISQNNAVPHSNFEIGRPWLSRDSKLENQPNPSGHNRNLGSYDTFSETQTESQVVGYEEDLSGRQKIIDRVRSQSMTMTPDKYTES